MRGRHWSFPLSAALTLLSVFGFLAFGLDFGIDFKGGTLIEVQATGRPADIGQVRDIVTGLNVGDVQIQEFGSARELLIRIGAAGGESGGTATVGRSRATRSAATSPSAASRWSARASRTSSCSNRCWRSCSAP